VAVSSLERDICEFWTGAQRVSTGSELIFCGSEISFIPSNDRQSTSRFTYSLHDVSQQDTGDRFKRFGPVVYGEEYILKRMGSREEVKEDRVKFVAGDGVCRVGPVLTGQPLTVAYTSSAKSDIKSGGVNVLKRPCSDPVDRWMQSPVEEDLFSLRHKASLADSGLAHFKKLAADENVSISHAEQRAVISAMVSGNFEGYCKSTKLDRRLVESLSRMWECLLKDSSVQESSSFSPAVESECMEIHSRNRSVFKQRVSDMVKRIIYPLLKEKITMDLKLQKK